MCEAQSATHQTLQQYTTQFNNALRISLYPSPPLHPHTRTRNLATPRFPLSLRVCPPPLHHPIPTPTPPPSCLRRDSAGRESPVDDDEVLLNVLS